MLSALHGGEWGLVAFTVFKTAWVAVKLALVSSILTRSRHLNTTKFIRQLAFFATVGVQFVAYKKE